MINFSNKIKNEKELFEKVVPFLFSYSKKKKVDIDLNKLTKIVKDFWNGLSFADFKHFCLDNEIVWENAEWKIYLNKSIPSKEEIYSKFFLNVLHFNQPKLNVSVKSETSIFDYNSENSDIENVEQEESSISENDVEQEQISEKENEHETEEIDNSIKIAEDYVPYNFDSALENIPAEISVPTDDETILDTIEHIDKELDSENVEEEIVEQKEFDKSKEFDVVSEIEEIEEDSDEKVDNSLKFDFWEEKEEEISDNEKKEISSDEEKVESSFDIPEDEVEPTAENSNISSFSDFDMNLEELKDDEIEEEDSSEEKRDNSLKFDFWDVNDNDNEIVSENEKLEDLNPESENSWFDMIINNDEVNSNSFDNEDFDNSEKEPMKFDFWNTNSEQPFEFWNEPEPNNTFEEKDNDLDNYSSSLNSDWDVSNDEFPQVWFDEKPSSFEDLFKNRKDITPSNEINSFWENTKPDNTFWNLSDNDSKWIEDKNNEALPWMTPINDFSENNEKDLYKNPEQGTEKPFNFWQEETDFSENNKSPFEQEEKPFEIEKQYDDSSSWNEQTQNSPFSVIPESSDLETEQDFSPKNEFSGDKDETDNNQFSPIDEDDNSFWKKENDEYKNDEFEPIKNKKFFEDDDDYTIPEEKSFDKNINDFWNKNNDSFKPMDFTEKSTENPSFDFPKQQEPFDKKNNFSPIQNDDFSRHEDRINTPSNHENDSINYDNNSHKDYSYDESDFNPLSNSNPNYENNNMNKFDNSWNWDYWFKTPSNQDNFINNDNKFNPIGNDFSQPFNVWNSFVQDDDSIDWLDWLEIEDEKNNSQMKYKSVGSSKSWFISYLVIFIWLYVTSLYLWIYIINLLK